MKASHDDFDSPDDASGVTSNLIAGSEKKVASGLLTGAVVMGAIGGLGPWFFHMPLILPPFIPNPVAALPLFIALVLVLRAAWETARIRRFGDPALNLTQVPVPCGGSVDGRIEIGKGLTSSPEFKLKLQCIHTYVENSGRNTHRVENVLWSNESKAALLPGGIVPVSIAVPEDQPASRGDAFGDRILWRLTITAPFSGVPFVEKYEIPVHGETEAAAAAHRARGSRSGNLTDDQLPDAAKQKRFTMIFMSIFGTAIAILGIVLMVHGVADMQFASASTGWPGTPGRITTSRMGQSSIFGQPDIVYSYAVGGRQLTGTIVEPHIFWTTHGRRQIVNDFPAGRDVPVHYNPAYPAKSCLLTGIDARIFQRFVAAVLVLTFAAILLIGGVCAPKYGVVTGNAITFPKGSTPARIMNWLFLSLLVEGLALWLVT